MNQSITFEDLIKINEVLFEIPREYRSDMRVPARVFSSRAILEDIMQDKSLWQLVNIATLPGIAQYALAMPDIHQGYGFPIGGVAATLIDEGGVISPGGIGYDINCGVRLLASSISIQEIQPYLERLATELFHSVPSGVGKGGKLKYSVDELEEVLRYGVDFLIKRGIGTEDDKLHCEEEGRMMGANPEKLSEHAKKRGSDQLGTLGSGNHFLEVQHIDEIFDQEVANAFGLSKGLVTIMIHCGSRGLGHQTCTDYVRKMIPRIEEFGITLPDRELVCAPFKSDIAQDYFEAMQAASNFAWANRHVIGQWVREAWQKILGSDATLNTVYDVSHNIGKVEQHTINGKKQTVLIHRKGATRAFPANHPENPAAYQSVGHPVFIPGTMGTASYVLVGTERGLHESFGSSCHGAGRRISRTEAKKTVRGSQLRQELGAQGIIIRSESDPGLAEEAPTAYKDVEEVVDVVQKAGLARKVVRLRPLAVIKGD